MDFSFSKLEQLSQRKWFVYVRQFHHGPFNENEVFERINAGRVDHESFIWSEDLGEWTPIGEVAPFSEAIACAPEFIGEEERAERAVVDFANPSWATTHFPQSRPAEFVEVTTGSAFESSDPLAANSWRPLVTIGAMTLAVVASAGIAYRVHQTAFPALRDVSRDDVAALQAAASDSGAARGAVAVTGAPQVYVGTNVPEGTRLTVHVDALEDTLLDRAHASLSYDVTVDRRGFAETPVVRFSNGSGLPRGEYRLSVTCSTCALTTEKTVFLGGKRDADYDSRLAVYNAKLRDQASGEIVELGQLSDTVLNQLKETTAHGRGGWTAFDKQWTALQTQIEAMFSQWNSSFFDNEVFYGSLYRDLKAVGLAVSDLHARQAAAFKSGDAAALSALETSVRDVRRQSSEFQAKLAQAARLQPYANGRPRSD